MELQSPVEIDSRQSVMIMKMFDLHSEPESVRDLLEIAFDESSGIGSAIIC